MPSVPPAATEPADSAIRIAELLHRRIGDLGHGRGRCDRRAADRAEAGAGDHGRHGEAAAQVADEGVGGAEKLLGHSGPRDEIAHQDEQRHHGQRVIASGLVDLGFDHRHGGREAPVAQIRDAEEADDAHRHGNRNAQQREHHHEAQPDQTFRHVGLTLSGSNALGSSAAAGRTALIRWTTAVIATISAMK